MRSWFVVAALLAGLSTRAAAQDSPQHGPEEKQAGSPSKTAAGGTSPAKPPPAKKKASRVLSVEDLLLKGKDPLQRESAALVLGARGSTAAVPLLRQALGKDHDKWVRTRAAEALGLLGDPAAIPWLHSALSSEKDQRVRRTVAQALLRLGQSAGIKELVWQLKAGNNNAKAEVMLFLVGHTGQPLGQNVDAWWNYFNEREGGIAQARRPTGSPALLPLGGVAPRGGVKKAAAGPFLHSRRPFTWQQVPAVVLEVGPTYQPVTPAVLLAYEQRRGRIPDGCLLLVRTGWQEASLRPAPRARPAARVGQGKAPSPMQRPVTTPVPWLTPEAVAFLLKRAPRLVGVGIDSPSLDREETATTARPTRDALLAADRLALESVGDLDRVVGNGTRMILFRHAASPAVTILALLP
jgi:kynurenine formamidase